MNYIKTFFTSYYVLLNMIKLVCNAALRLVWSVRHLQAMIRDLYEAYFRVCSNTGVIVQYSWRDERLKHLKHTNTLFNTPIWMSWWGGALENGNNGPCTLVLVFFLTLCWWEKLRTEALTWSLVQNDTEAMNRFKESFFIHWVIWIEMLTVGTPSTDVSVFLHLTDLWTLITLKKKERNVQDKTRISHDALDGAEGLRIRFSWRLWQTWVSAVSRNNSIHQWFSNFLSPGTP